MPLSLKTPLTPPAPPAARARTRQRMTPAGILTDLRAKKARELACIGLACTHAGMHTWAGHAQTFVFPEFPFVTAGPAHSGTYWHINGGEESMYNRVEELLKVAKGSGKQTATEYRYGMYARSTRRYGVPAPNYGDIPTLFIHRNISLPLRLPLDIFFISLTVATVHGQRIFARI